MKKLVLLLCMGMFAAGVYGQDRYYLMPNLQNNVGSKIEKMRDYDLFDAPYYEYAVRNVKRKVAVEYLKILKEYRRNMYAAATTGEERLQYSSDYEKKLASWKRQYPLTYSESAVFGEYQQRPVTRGVMLSNAESFQVHEKLMYASLETKVATKQGAEYLKQVFLFRQAVSAISRTAPNATDVYANMRQVLDKQGLWVTLTDNMTAEERAQIEEYLQTPVSVKGESYTIPVSQFFAAYRAKLASYQRRDYPNVHYK